jgi:hypothetical protein
MNILKLVIVGVVLLASGGSASAQGWWNMLGPVRNNLGSQFRHASPIGWQVALAMNRSIPPQVKNGGGFYGGQRYYGGAGYGIPYAGIAYQQELAAIRSIPPQVKNEWAKQARGASPSFYHQPQVVYAPSPVPVAPPVAPIANNVPGGGVVTAPPPSYVIPNGR